MAYAAQSDVDGLVAQFTIGAATKPTATQSGVFITDISGEIDSTLAGSGYSVPVAAPAYFVRRLAILNAYGAAALVLRAMFPERAGANDANAALYSLYEKRYQDGLKLLQDGEGIPPDVPVSSSGAYVAPSTYSTRNPEVEEAVGAIAEPLFKVSKVF